MNEDTTEIYQKYFFRGQRLLVIHKMYAALCEILIQQYNVKPEEAENITATFLKSFRSCPDNAETSLESWRSYLWSQALPDSLKERNFEIYKKWLQLRYKYLAVIKDYENLLKSLRNEYCLALITNGPSNAQWEKINMLNLRNYFDCILVSADLPWEKPNPNIFWTACNILNVKPDECIMIGDKLETDIKGGKDAKLGATIWIPLNSEQIGSNKNRNIRMENDNDDNIINKDDTVPDVIVKNLMDILHYLPNCNRRSSFGGPGGIGGSTASMAVAANRRYSQIPATTTTTTTSTSKRSQQQYRRVLSLSEIDRSCESSLDGS